MQIFLFSNEGATMDEATDETADLYTNGRSIDESYGENDE